MGRVDGKVALITGGARGQGRSHALCLAQEGADIIAIDICGPIKGVPYPAATPEDLDETVRLVRETGRNIVAIQADTRDARGLEESIGKAVESLGGLHVVVANAGILIVAPWDQVTDETWQTVIDVNLTGTWNTLRATFPHLIAGGGGSVMVISSNAGLAGLPFLAPYVASKYALTGLAKAMANEGARHNIRVNSIHPTGVETPMTSNFDANTGFGELTQGLQENPRLAGMFTNTMLVDVIQPIDVSYAVLYLASDESKYVTAHAMTVDAGITQH